MAQTPRRTTAMRSGQVPAFMLAASVLTLLLSQFQVVVDAQFLRTVNNTILLQIPGATLALSSDATSGPSTSSFPGAISPASQSDLQNSIASTISTLQPQVGVRMCV